MSQSILIQFNKDDSELREALARDFPDNHQVGKVRGFDSAVTDIVQAIIPLGEAALTFLTAYFTIKMKEKKNKRIVINKNKSISFEGFTPDEIADVLKPE